MAAGTIFLDVLVWRATIEAANACGRGPLRVAPLFQLRGHEGSIHRCCTLSQAICSMFHAFLPHLDILPLLCIFFHVKACHAPFPIQIFCSLARAPAQLLLTRVCSHSPRESSKLCCL